MSSSVAAVGLPGRWPSAWPQLYRPLRDRAYFVLTVMVLTTVGLLLLGDPGAQWWAIVVPLLLLIGPATVPMRAVRSVDSERVQMVSGQLAERGSGIWLQPVGGGPELPVDTGPAERALRAYAGSPALLVWSRPRRPAAIVLPDLGVGYLRRAPRGVQSTPAGADVPRLTESGWTLPTR